MEIVEAGLPERGACKGVDGHARGVVRKDERVEADVALEDAREDLPNQGPRTKAGERGGGARGGDVRSSSGTSRSHGEGVPRWKVRVTSVVPHSYCAPEASRMSNNEEVGAGVMRFDRRRGTCAPESRRMTSLPSIVRTISGGAAIGL
jgi:hypothetical protein